MTSRMLSVAVLLGLLASPAEGHLSVICTASSPQQPNTFAFWFITYRHGGGSGTAPGKVYIRDPSAKVIEADFSNICTPASPYARGTGSTPEQFETVLKRECLGQTDPAGRVPVFADSAVECYNADNNNPLPDYTIGLRKGQTINGGHSRDMEDYFYVVVDSGAAGLRSGTYVTWFTGTNDILDPCNTALPCSVAAKPWTFDITVVAGPAKCTTAPPTIANSEPTSLVGCDGASDDVLAGMLCHAQCKSGYSKIGVLECLDNGDGTASWGSDFACTNDVVCKLPKASNNNNQGVSADIKGVMHPCTTLTPAGTSCPYTCNGFGDQVSPGTITCTDVNGEGQWMQGDSLYNGCAWPAPCATDGAEVLVNGVAVAGTALNGAETHHNSQAGVQLSKIPQPLSAMQVHVPALPVASGATLGLSCCGSEACEFVVSHYHCPPCSGSGNGGFPATLPVNGFKSASCGPRYGATEERMASYHITVQPGETKEVPTTVEASAFVVFSRAGTFTEPWCPSKAVGCGGPCPINVCKCLG